MGLKGGSPVTFFHFFAEPPPGLGAFVHEAGKKAVNRAVHNVIYMYICSLICHKQETGRFCCSAQRQQMGHQGRDPPSCKVIKRH